MRAKIFILISVILFLLVGLVYERTKDDSIQNLSESSYNNVNNLTGAALTIEKDSITNKGMKVELSNQTKDILPYGSFYAIEKYTSGKWYKISYVKENCEWTLEGHWLDPNDTIEIKTEWEWAYGKLNKGLYRIVKPVTSGDPKRKSGDDNSYKDYYLAAEFEIK